MCFFSDPSSQTDNHHHASEFPELSRAIPKFCKVRPAMADHWYTRLSILCRREKFLLRDTCNTSFLSDCSATPKLKYQNNNSPYINYLELIHTDYNYLVLN